MTARDPNPHPAPANSNDDWQDWPPDSSAGDPRSEASLWLAKWADKSITRVDHQALPAQPTAGPSFGTEFALGE
jgi:hypothetical protein